MPALAREPQRSNASLHTPGVVHCGASGSVGSVGGGNAGGNDTGGSDVGGGGGGVVVVASNNGGSVERDLVAPGHAEQDAGQRNATWVAVGPTQSPA